MKLSGWKVCDADPSSPWGLSPARPNQTMLKSCTFPIQTWPRASRGGVETLQGPLPPRSQGRWGGVAAVTTASMFQPPRPAAPTNPLGAVNSSGMGGSTYAVPGTGAYTVPGTGAYTVPGTGALGGQAPPSGFLTTPAAGPAASFSTHPFEYIRECLDPASPNYRFRVS